MIMKNRTAGLRVVFTGAPCDERRFPVAVDDILIIKLSIDYFLLRRAAAFCDFLPILKIERTGKRIGDQGKCFIEYDDRIT